MGNSVMDRAPDGVTVRVFYSSTAWIEGRAEDQLLDIARLDGVRAVAGFPDLHPGKYGPVGAAVLSNNLHPQLAGSDIGCGIALYALDLSPRRIKPDKAGARLRALGDWDDTDRSDALAEIGLSAALAPGLGTIGGGNHFCELQVLRDAGTSGLDPARAYLMVHSGSRGLGHAILTKQLADGIPVLRDAEARAYMAVHDEALRWAKLNRQIIAERAAAALRCDLSLVTDVTHNVITRQRDGWLHRKGAAAHASLIPLAGTRATDSYLITPGTADALASTAHGAGRRYDRSSMHGRVSAKKSSLAALRRTDIGSRVICDDKAMLIEEAPLAYKSAAAVLADMEALGVAHHAATLRPVVTFKNTKEGRR